MKYKIKGEGSCSFRGEHSCRVEFQVVDLDTGKTERVRSESMHVKSHTKAEKVRCIREFREKLESGVDYSQRNLTFAEWSEEWMKLRKSRMVKDDGSAMGMASKGKKSKLLSPATIIRDEGMLKVMLMHLGDKKLDSITTRTIDNFYSALLDGESPSGKPLSGTYVHDIHVKLNQILGKAVKYKLIAENPCEGAEVPERDTAEKEPLSLVDAARMRALLDASNPRPSLVGFRLALFAGLRRGEVVAVRWKDLDLEKKELLVCRALCTKTLTFKSTKNGEERVIPLDASTVEYLRAFKEEQVPKLLAEGRSVGESCIVAKATEDYTHPENFSRSLRRFCAANGFRGVTPHILRHTYCTMLFAADNDLKTVQYLMGHRDPATTLKVYAHYVESNGRKAAEAVEKMMDSLPTSNVIRLDAPEGRWGIKAKVV